MINYASEAFVGRFIMLMSMAAGLALIASERTNEKAAGAVILLFATAWFAVDALRRARGTG